MKAIRMKVGFVAGTCLGATVAALASGSGGPSAPGRRAQLAAGGFHSVLLREDGTVWAWGNNAYGQLGAAKTHVTTMWPYGHSSTPLQVVGDEMAPLTDVVEIAAGYHFTLARKADGTVWAWGCNAFGQLGDGSGEQDPSVAREFTRQSAVPGRVRRQDADRTLDDVVAISAGWQHALAVRRDGTVWTWGDNTVGPLGDGSATNTAAALQVRGPDGAGALEGIASVAAGADHTAALGKDGTVWTWGGNRCGQLGDGTTTNRLFPVRVQGAGGAGAFGGVQAVAAGVACTLALKKDGTVWAWGCNAFGQLGDGTREDRANPVQVRSEDGRGFLSGVRAIAAGRHHAAALMQDGTLRAWGFHEGGLRGDGTRDGSLLPVPVGIQDDAGPLQDIIRLATGSRHTLALRADGVIMAWGDNHCGQLGDAAVSSGLRPVPVRDVPVPAIVVHGAGRWIKAARAHPGTRVPVAEDDFRWATRYAVRGSAAEADILDFTAVSNGCLAIAFDVRVSSAVSRTLDVALLPDALAPESVRHREAWFLVWGREPGKLSAVAADVAGIDGEWRHYEILTDLDARTYAVRVAGQVVADGCGFRYGTGHLPAGTAFGRLRVGVTHDNTSITGRNPVVDGEYADIANVRVETRP